jgi:cell division protein FtsA
MSSMRGITPRLKPISPRRTVEVSVLDIGTSKIVCLIGRLRPVEAGAAPGRTHRLEILGVGHQRARGIKGGAIVDMTAAEKAIRLAVDAAERAARARVESVIVSVSCGRPSSERYHVGVPVAGHPVAEDDLQRVLQAGSSHSLRAGRALLHSLPVGYAVDGGRVAEPTGMVGAELGVDMHLVSTDAAPVRNLMLCVEHCHLEVEAFVAAPYASGLVALSADEAEIGATVIDMGAGTTTVALFAGGNCVHVDGLAMGGHHVTLDIARGLSTTIEHAERLKTLHASVLPGITDDHDMIDVLPVGEIDGDNAHHVPKSYLVSIVKPRVEETLELVRDRLKAAGHAPDASRRIVLTGGACQLTGMGEFAARLLGGQVRLGRPLGVRGLPDAAKGPAFSTAAGLLAYPQLAAREHFDAGGGVMRATGTNGYFSRMGQWLKQGF